MKRTIASVIIFYCITVNLGLAWWHWFDGVAPDGQWAHIMIFHSCFLIGGLFLHPDVSG